MLRSFRPRSQTSTASAPCSRLTPGVGDIDIAVASELLESGRTVANGFVTPDRTHVISSLSRFYAMDEKIAMGDGRFDQDKLIKIINQHAKDALLVDMDALAKQSGSIINAVMLGAIAGCGRLPLSREQFEAAIREDGKAIDSNLKGFRAGYDAARARLQPAKPSEKKSKAAATPAFVEHEVARTFPAVAQATGLEGVRRLINYQNVAYGRLYLNRLRPIIADDQAMGAQGRLLKEVARHLAVRMSYEDVVRVAQAKIAPARMQRIAREELRVERASHFPFTIFSSPVLKNFASCFRRSWRSPSCDWRSAKVGLAGFISAWRSIPPRSAATCDSGCSPNCVSCGPTATATSRNSTNRQLALADRARPRKHSTELALEVAECARLIKGYGDTHARGLANYRAIETRVIRPALAGQIPSARAADAIASARTAALVDPDGESLTKCLAEIDGQPALRIAAE